MTHTTTDETAKSETPLERAEAPARPVPGSGNGNGNGTGNGSHPAPSPTAGAAWDPAVAAEDDAHPACPIVAGTSRRALRWWQVLIAGLVCFAMWLVLDAPTLLRNAQASPFGTRRTVAITLLRPVVQVDRALGLSHVVGSADRALGRTGTGVVKVSKGVSSATGHRHPSAPAVPTAGARVRADAVGPDGFPQLPVPTTADPLHVLVVGDSLGVDLGNPLVNVLAASGVVDATADAHIDTGLSRPDYFDWPAELRDDLAVYSPEVVVVFMGANDPQNMVVDGNAVAYGTTAWAEDYGQRVDSFANEATRRGTRVILVGMPPMADPGLGAAMQVLNQAFALSARVPGVTYFASWPVMSDPSGAFQTYLPDGSGNEVQVREPDGTHITPAGADRLARAIVGELDRALGLHLPS
jgi:lysophospholipase L1-like esterase